MSVFAYAQHPHCMGKDTARMHWHSCGFEVFIQTHSEPVSLEFMNKSFRIWISELAWFRQEEETCKFSRKIIIVLDGIRVSSVSDLSHSHCTNSCFPSHIQPSHIHVLKHILFLYMWLLNLSEQGLGEPSFNY